MSGSDSEGLLICNDWQMDRMQYRWTQGVKTLFTQCDATYFPDLYMSEEVIHSMRVVQLYCKFLSVETDRSEQTVQAEVRLLLGSSLIRVYSVCSSICIC